MSLSLYNTLSGKKEIFKPINEGKVDIYVCGPTVYDMSHIGHARAYVAFDVVVRYLRRHYDVTYVRNFTDVDDKIIKRAAESGSDAKAISEKYIEEFLTDMASLGVAEADVSPKVSEHIQEIIDMTQSLIDRGLAYDVDGDVFYAVRKFEGYGKLSGRKLDDMEAGARIDVDSRKRDPMDFALWKKGKAEAKAEPVWDSPWGKGRPGWHIECSAMSRKHLGDSFDIHGGGKDLIFPHHENEIAQSEGSTGKPYSHHWMHNGFVNIDNEKMSKSLGNFFTVREVLKKFDAQTMRFYLLTTHYRSPINFSDVALKEAETRVKYLYESLARLDEKLGDSKPDVEGELRAGFEDRILARFDEAMNDDFNTAKVLGDLSEPFKLINEILAQSEISEPELRTLALLRSRLADIGSVLGMFIESPAEILSRIESRKHDSSGVDGEAVDALIEGRRQARADKDWGRADEIRAQLDALGVVIKDSPEGTTWELA